MNYKISKELHVKMRGDAIKVKEDTNISSQTSNKKNLISKTKLKERTQLTVVTTKPTQN